MVDHPTVVDVVGSPPFAADGWHSYHLRYHGFDKISTERDTTSPFKFSLFEHRWEFYLFPGGRDDAVDGMISVALRLTDEFVSGRQEVWIEWEVSILDSDGDDIRSFRPGKTLFNRFARDHDKDNFLPRSLVLDPSCNILNHGTLVVELKVKSRVRMDLPCKPFIPKIACENKMEGLWYQDPEYKDVVFRVQSNSGKLDDGEQSKIYAHRAVLQVCAPGLFELCEPYGKDTEVPLSNVHRAVFDLLLGYVYGLEIATADWKLHARELLDAADRYGVSDLKLEAEARLVQFTEITMSNVVDLLQYAHAKNCDFLKEGLMDFFIKNRTAALRLVSLESFPETQSLFVGLLVSAEHSHADYESEDYHLMRISRLRRELEDLELEVDGSRETLIKRLEEAEDEENPGSGGEAANESQDGAGSEDEEEGVDSDGEH